MTSMQEIVAGAHRIHVVASFGPALFDDLDALDAAEQATSPALPDRDWIITGEEFTGADGWETVAHADGVRDLRRPAGARTVGRGHARVDVHDRAAQLALSDGRFLTFVERG